MIETDIEPFVRSPVGRYTCTGSAIVWCASPSLCGALLWGRPREQETRTILRIFDHYEQTLAPSIDALLDTRGVELVDPAGLAVLFGWLRGRREALRERVRLQASVVGAGAVGLLLSGIPPVLGLGHPFRVFFEPEAAFRAVLGEAGVEIGAALEVIAARVRGVPPELQVVRAQLAADAGASIESAARELGTSARSLQRLLSRHGTSFHAEALDARLALAKALMQSDDAKLSAISARVGISERSLTALFRAKTGLSPAEWRRRHGG